jgi:hypothetical protein
MVPRITTILPRLTGEWATLRPPDTTLAVCGEIGATAWRDRVLTPVTTVPWLLRHLLHGHTVPGVRKELTVFARVDTLVRMVMGHAAMFHHVGMERLSWVEALRWLGAPRPGRLWGAWLVNPSHPHRVEPRVKKRRPKRCPWMIQPRQARRQPLVPPAAAANFMPFQSYS